jgi:hypothetical protein
MLTQRFPLISQRWLFPDLARARLSNTLFSASSQPDSSTTKLHFKKRAIARLTFVGM